MHVTFCYLSRWGACLLGEFVDKPYDVIECAPESFDEEDEGCGVEADEVGFPCLGEVSLGEVEARELRPVQAWPFRVG